MITMKPLDDLEIEYYKRRFVEDFVWSDKMSNACMVISCNPEWCYHTKNGTDCIIKPRFKCEHKDICPGFSPQYK